MSKSGITRWDFDVSALLIASQCGERICIAFSYGYKLPSWQAYDDFIFAKEEFLNGISMFLRFLFQVTAEKEYA